MMDDTSEDDEDEEATASPTEVWSDYYAKTLLLWMIKVDTDGCTFEEEKNDEGGGGKGRSRCSDLSGKTLFLWMINVVKDDLSEGQEDEEIWRWRSSFFFGYEKATDLRTFGAPVRQMVQRRTPSHGRPVTAYFLVIRYLSFSWFVFFLFFLVNFLSFLLK